MNDVESMRDGTLLAALEQLKNRAGSDGKDYKTFAKRLGIDASIFYAWRKGLSKPTLEHIVKLGKLESTLQGTDVMVSCKRWTCLAGRDENKSEDQIRANLTPDLPLEDIPELRAMLQGALLPLHRLPLNELQALEMVLCKISQMAADDRLNDWLLKNPGGTILFAWDYDKDDTKEHLCWPRTKKWITKLLNPDERKKWPAGSPLPKVVGCITLNPGDQNENVEKQKKAVKGAAVQLLTDLKNEGVQGTDRLSIYTSATVPVSGVDRWCFNGIGHDSLRGSIVKETSELVSIIENLYDRRTEIDLKEMSGNLASLHENIPDWTMQAVEVPRKGLEKFLTVHKIAFQKGGLRPLDGWDLVLPAASTSTTKTK